MQFIERKSLLYRSELGFWCINPVQGCSHGCRYPCHGFMLARQHGRVRDYAEWCEPRIVSNAQELLDQELTRKRVLPASVHLCLSTDPFMVGYPEVTALSLALIARMNRSMISCHVLTKGILPAELANWRRFSSANSYGISLISMDEGFRCQWEPGAAPYAERVAALRRLHEAGARTLVHMEPYPTPNLLVQDLGALLNAIGFVNEIHFGGWNYNQRVTEYHDAQGFYHQQAEQVRAFCRARSIACETW